MGWRKATHGKIIGDLTIRWLGQAADEPLGVGGIGPCQPALALLGQGRRQAGVDRGGLHQAQGRLVMLTALWLQESGTHGQAGLYGRLEALALAYQGERPDLEAEDLTTVVVRGLADPLALAGPASTPHRLGFILGKLRVGHGPRVNGNQGRQWLVTQADLDRWVESYGMRVGGAEGGKEERG